MMGLPLAAHLVQLPIPILVPLEEVGDLRLQLCIVVVQCSTLALNFGVRKMIKGGLVLSTVGMRLTDFLLLSQVFQTLLSAPPWRGPSAPRGLG